MSALAKNQKAYLAQLARKAFEVKREEARRDGAVLDGGIYMNAMLNDFEEWRHEEVARACGKLGLRCCTQNDYGAVKGHFLAMLGAEGAAVKAMVRGEGNDGRIARYKLRQELEAGGLKWSYGESICRNKYKCDLANANTKQVWTIVFDVRRSVAAKKRKAEGNPF
jgi:hypothetical protein